MHSTRRRLVLAALTSMSMQLAPPRWMLSGADEMLPSPAFGKRARSTESTCTYVSPVWLGFLDVEAHTSSQVRERSRHGWWATRPQRARETACDWHSTHQKVRFVIPCALHVGTNVSSRETISQKGICSSIQEGRRDPCCLLSPNHESR